MAHIGPRVIGPNIAVTVLTIVAVCLRLLARLPVFGTELWLDDWTIVLSVVRSSMPLPEYSWADSRCADDSSCNGWVKHQM